MVDLRAFFDDLAVWGWAGPDGCRRAAARPLRPARPDDPAWHQNYAWANCSTSSFDCLLDFASHGSWLKVPLGKHATERTVPLDEVTLAALDA